MTTDEGRLGMGGKLSPDDSARLSEHVLELTEANLPLGSGLRATAMEMPRGKLRRAMDSIAQSIEGGATLEEALSARGGGLPEHLRGLVLVGSRSGRMSQVLGRFVAFTNVGVELRRQLRISLAYPIMALLISLTVMSLICWTLVGSFTSIFRDFGIELPMITVFLISISQVFVGEGSLLVEFMFSLLIGVICFFGFTSESTRRSFLGRVPIIGSVWKNISLAEFCHLLALLLEGDLPLPEALRLTRDGVGDARIQRACAAMQRDVGGGMSLSQAVAPRRVFPASLSRLLFWAEGHQSLPQALHTAGEMFESRARAQAGFAGTLTGVMSFVSITVGVFIVVVGLFLPFIKLISALSG